MASGAKQDSAQLLVALMTETIRTFFLLRAAGKRIGAVTERGAGYWGLLRSLSQEGPQTVPQAARARPVSRQHIQKLADQMAAEGVIDFVGNPAHARSMLMKITRKGRAVLSQLDQRVAVEAKRLARGLKADRLKVAVETLREFRARLLTEQGTGGGDAAKGG